MEIVIQLKLLNKLYKDSEIYIMDPKVVENELKNNKIREGPIYKRTKFLQEWRQRWMVLTMNYILIFTSRNLKELAEFIDLREVKTYKSYLRKEEDMIPAGFKIRTLEDMFYFCARNSNEKWTWIVSLERLMDFKYAGKSPYNNAEWIKTKGFMGQREYERGKFDEPEFQQPKEPEKPKVVEQPKEVQKAKEETSQNDLNNKLKILEEEMERLKQKEQEMLQKERDQEEMFLFELNKLKKTEESLRELQVEAEEKTREAERIIAQGTQTKQVIKEVFVEKPVEVFKTETSEQPVEKPSEELVITKTEDQKIIDMIEEAAEELESTQTGVQDHNKAPIPSQEKEVPENTENKETPVQAQSKEVPQKTEVTMTVSAVTEIKPQQAQQKPEPETKLSETTPVTVTKSSGMSKRIEDMKNFFESKRMGNVGPPQPAMKKESPKKIEKKDQGVSLHMCRDKVVCNMLEEFHPKAYNYAGLRYIIQFLVRICSERSLGYQSFLIREAKANANRFLFAEVLLQLINDFKNYEEFGSLARIIEVLIFEVPGIFKLNHFDLVKRKLIDLLYHAPDQHPDLPILLKTLYVVHKMKNLEKNSELKEKLKNICEKMMSVEGKNWANKLIEDL